MPPSTRYKKQQRQQCQCRGCRALCCSSGFSVSSPEIPDRGCTERYASISSLAHAVVQERLDQMIRELKEAGCLEEQMRRRRRVNLVIMVAMENPSYDPRQDFRYSILEMIEINQISRPRDLRLLLEYYLSVNSDESTETILTVFHKVCIDIFL